MMKNKEFFYIYHIFPYILCEKNFQKKYFFFEIFFHTENVYGYENFFLIFYSKMYGQNFQNFFWNFFSYILRVKIFVTSAKKFSDKIYFFLKFFSIQQNAPKLTPKQQHTPPSSNTRPQTQTHASKIHTPPVYTYASKLTSPILKTSNPIHIYEYWYKESTLVIE